MDEDEDWDDENYCPCGGCADMAAAEGREDY